MRVRALISALLMAVWLMPALGGACPPDAAGGEGHAHVHSGVHADEAPEHGHGQHASSDHHGAEAPAAAVPGADPASDEPVCCERSSQPPAAQLVLPDSDPRPELSVSLLHSSAVAAPTVARSATGSEFRRRQPPPLPYARTRRPLLI